MCQTTIKQTQNIFALCYTKYQKKNIHYEKPRLRFYITVHVYFLPHQAKGLMV